MICLRELLPEAVFFDADAMARQLTERNEEVLAEIGAEFGREVIQPNGELNRAALRAIVFAAPAKRRALEEILHPRIRQCWSGEAEQHRETNDFFFADIPLLYETGGEKLCDRVVVVGCSEETQMSRLMERAGMNRAAASAVIDAQMPLAQKIRRADHVVWNNGPRSALSAQGRSLVSLWKSQ